MEPAETPASQQIPWRQISQGLEHDANQRQQIVTLTSVRCIDAQLMGSVEVKAVDPAPQLMSCEGDVCHRRCWCHGMGGNRFMAELYQILAAARLFGEGKELVNRSPRR